MRCTTHLVLKRPRFILLPILLLISLAGHATVVNFSSNPSLSIPDGAYDGSLSSMAQDTIEVEGSGVITKVEVTVGLDHSWLGDLTIRLIGPSGSFGPGDIYGGLTLMNQPGVPSSSYGDSTNLSSAAPITFSDTFYASPENMGTGCSSNDTVGLSSGCLNTNFFPDPDGGVGFNLAEFNGTQVQGHWKLAVGDSAIGDPGKLISWGLAFTVDEYVLPAPPPPPSPPVPPPLPVAAPAPFILFSLGLISLFGWRRNQ